MRMNCSRLAAPVLIASLCAAVSRASDFDAVINSLFSVTEIRQVSISPDGTRVAWVQEIKASTKRSSAGTAVYVQDLARKSPPSRITAGCGACAEQSIGWKPDGSSLAFLSDKEKPGQFQLYVKDTASAPPRRLTNAKGSLAQPKWSPTGNVLAFLLTEDATGAQDPSAPKAAFSGVVEERIPEQRIITIDLASGRLREISPKDLYVYEYDWSPDGKTFAAIAAHGEGDDNWYLAQLYTIGVASGETRSIWKPPLQMAVPRWSPDGRTIAVIHGLMSDEFITGGEIFAVPALGGQARNLTPGMKASASWLTWLDPHRIVFTELIDGQSGLAALNPETRQISALWKGIELISAGEFNGSISLSRDGKTQAVVLQSFQHPPEVWVGPAGAWTQLTHLNTGAQPAWGNAENLHWQSHGLGLQGWLLYPLHYDRARRYPMAVAVHGGPSSMSRPRWPATSNSSYVYNLATLSHQGYFVFYPNPRGSYGQDEAFTQANVKNFGYGDFQDILTGVDHVVHSLPVDTDRIGIAGWSYGGYMTMWAVTQTRRFRAAVAGAGIANWQSYYGENRIDQWLIPFFGASVYDDPAVYKRSSPIDFIKNVRTPTLILVGEQDGECPVPQSVEFWHALKTLGVKTRLIVYPGEGHQIVTQEHRRDVMNRTLAWFNQYLGTHGGQ